MAGPSRGRSRGFIHLLAAADTTRDNIFSVGWASAKPNYKPDQLE
jgi:hypothetical protein